MPGGLPRVADFIALMIRSRVSAGSITSSISRNAAILTARPLWYSSATSFFWTGIVGAVAMTAVGMWFWEPMARPDWLWMALLCVSGVLGHWLLIKCYEMAEASAVQPFAYFHLVWSAILGISIFGETLRPAVIIGAALVVAAGLFTLWRERRQG